MKWKKIAAILALSFFWTITGPALASPAESTISGRIIYVAGNPGDYPFEYYDSRTGSYQGIIPDILKGITSSTGIGFQYIEPSADDNREYLIRNLQVDMISDYRTDHLFEGVAAGMPLLHTGGADSLPERSFGYTVTVDERDKEAVEQALENLGMGKITAIMAAYLPEKEDAQKLPLYYVVIAAGIVIILAVVLIAFIRRNDQWKKRAISAAYQDELTGDGNFRRWKDDYRELAREEVRNQYCVVFVDTGMERIAQIYGYEETEKDLKLIAGAVRENVKEGEAFSRFYEDCYVMLKKYRSQDALERDLRKIDEEVNLKMNEAKKPYRLPLHFGVYILTSIDGEPDRALHFSRVSADFAKEARQLFSVYSQMVEKRTIEEYALEHEAIHGLLRNDFVMFLQPMVNLKTGKVTGGKSLVRWQHPSRGLLKPDAFIGVLEKNHLIEQLDFQMFGQLCAFLGEWKDKGDTIQIMCSFSDANFAMKDFPARLIDTAKAYGIPGENVVIEVKYASIPMENMLLKEALKELRAYGFNIYMADFHINDIFCEFLECGITHLKLNRQLLSCLEYESTKTLVTGLVDMAHKMDISVICEGIENQEQENFLKRIGCDLGLGFYYCLPISKEEFGNTWNKLPVGQNV